MLTRPASDEFFEYYGRYIDQVPERDVLGILDEQRATMRETLGHLPPDRAGYRYAPEKWTIADVIQHLSDAERIFAYRALRIARGDETPLPSWDENAYAARTDYERGCTRNRGQRRAWYRTGRLGESLGSAHRPYGTRRLDIAGPCPAIDALRYATIRACRIRKSFCARSAGYGAGCAFVAPYRTSC